MQLRTQNHNIKTILFDMIIMNLCVLAFKSETLVHGINQVYPNIFVTSGVFTLYII